MSLVLNKHITKFLDEEIITSQIAADIKAETELMRLFKIKATEWESDNNFIFVDTNDRDLL